MASEKNFEHRVKRWLHTVGVYAAGTPTNQMSAKPCGWYIKYWGGGMSKAGIPDVLMCVNSVFVAVELKGEKGRPSDLQKMNTARINGAGGVAVILYPDGFAEFQEIIKGVIDKCSLAIQELKLLKTAHSSTSCVILTDY